MFYEPKTLIIVYKDEMLANQMKKLIETKDDFNGVVTGTTDNSINVVAWTEKVWLTNKKAGNIKDKVLFLGHIKGVDELIPVIDVRFEKHGIRYGWAGNQAVVYAIPSEIKSIKSYYDFYKELEGLPVPKVIKDIIKPKIMPVEEKQFEEELHLSKKEKAGFFANEKKGVKKVVDTIGDAFLEAGVKVSIFSEENFKNKQAMERQMLFFGIISLYNNELEKFMNS